MASRRGGLTTAGTFRLQRMKEKFDDPLMKLALFEPVQFISLYLKDELNFSKVTPPTLTPPP